MNAKERRYGRYLAALFVSLGIAWAGIATGIRAGIAMTTSAGCSTLIVGAPTHCQQALMSMNTYTQYALLVAVAALGLGIATLYVLHNKVE